MGEKLLRRNIAVSDNTQNRKVQPLQIIKHQLQERKVPVQVPTAGGGFITMQVPESQAKKYAQNNKKEYNPGMRVYDTEVIEQAKQQHPERYEDAADNGLNNAIAAGGALARGAGKLLFDGVKTGLNWLPRLSFSNAYTTGIGLATTPTNSAIVSDAVFGAIGAGTPLVDMIENGITPTNTAETILGFTPIYGPAYRQFMNTTSQAKAAFDKTVMPYRVSRALNNSIDNTIFYNKDIEHVSPFGITNGAKLDLGNEGIHFSPLGSNTSASIHNSMNYPFKRVGTWTYTNNNAPETVEDMGYFGRGFNEKFDQLVDDGATNFRYINKFESPGSESYVTTDASSIALSKNIGPDFDQPLYNAGWAGNTPRMAEADYIADLQPLARGNFRGKIGDKEITLPRGGNFYYLYTPNEGIKVHRFRTREDYMNSLKKLHNDYVKTLSDIDRELYLSYYKFPKWEDSRLLNKSNVPTTLEKGIKQRTQDIIDDFYKSEEYKDRFVSKASEEDYNRLLNNLDGIQKDYTVIGFIDPEKTGFARTSIAFPSMGLNSIQANSNVTTHHEFAHLLAPREAASKYFYKHKTVKDLNKNLLHDAEKYSTERFSKLEEKSRKYLLDQDELRSRILPAVEEMFANGWSVDKAYQESKALEQSRLKEFFTEEYIKKLLGGLLTGTPILLNNKNNQ